MLHAEPAQVQVVPLEAIRRRQHEVGELAGRVAVEIDADEEFERLERLAHPRLAADREHRVAAHYEQAAQRRVGALDVVGHQVAGQGPTDAARASEGAVEEVLRRVASAAARRVRVEAARIEVATAAIEVAGDEHEHLHEPVRKRALLTHVRARRHRRARALGLRELARELPNAGRIEADHRRDAFGREAANEAPQRIEARRVRVDHRAIDPTAGLDLAQHRGEQVDVAVRSHEHHFVRRCSRSRCVAR